MLESKKIGGAESGYQFEFRADGVYLTVYPNAEGERLFELSDMRQILRESNVADYDVGVLSRAMREASGRPQKIAEAVEVPSEAEELPAEENYAVILVEISRDKMQATVRYDTRNGAKLPTEEMILTALNEAGVVYGLDEIAISQGAKSLSSFTAAVGTAPVNGENAYIDRKFNLGTRGVPVVDEFDKVDYKDLNLFVLAKENQTLAIRIPQTKGTPGTNVLGEEVPAQHGRPCPLPEGKNTRVVGERLIATCNGQIVERSNRISIDPRLEIKGNVGVSTGNIDFDGQVSIRGNVEGGFNVTATGDIEIKGSVNASEIRGRNVYVSGGVTGADKAKIFAECDIRTAFVENAFLEAAGDIYVADTALHSQIRAGKRLFLGDVDDKKKSRLRGQIVGGHSVAGEFISAKILGNDSFVVTKVSVGVDPALQKEYQDLKLRYKADRRRLTQITQTLATLSKIDVNKLPPERLANLNALTRSQFPLAGQIKRHEKRLLEIEDLLLQMKKGQIKVSDTIYPGVRLSVNNLLKSIQTEYKRCTISLNEDGEVEVGAY